MKRPITKEDHVEKTFKRLGEISNILLSKMGLK